MNSDIWEMGKNLSRSQPNRYWGKEGKASLKALFTMPSRPWTRVTEVDVLEANICMGPWTQNRGYRAGRGWSLVDGALGLCSKTPFSHLSDGAMNSLN